MHSERTIPEDLLQRISTPCAYTRRGKVTEVSGPVVRATLNGVCIGDLVQVEKRNPREHRSHHTASSGTASLANETISSWILGQVVGFTNTTCILSLFGSTDQVAQQATVESLNGPPRIQLGPNLLGAVLDGLGNILESPVTVAQEASPCSTFPLSGSLYEAPPPALSRKPISQVLETGIRAIDAFIPLGRGQRLAIFAEPGIGKSTLMGSLAKHSAAEVNVIALIGERGREVKEFLQDSLSAETRKKTVLVISTSDEAPLLRANAALVATRVAEYFREAGLDVLLQIDSLTRLSRALREVGLAAGEIPVRRGYPPSVFQKLPELIERTGTSAKGSITALYTVLLSADLDEDPMVEEIKGITDGHLLLSRKLAEEGHYPAIDVLRSISRLAPRLFEEEERKAATYLRTLIGRLESDRELLALGGTPDEELRQALQIQPEVKTFLRQSREEYHPREETLETLIKLAQPKVRGTVSGDNSA